MSETSALENSTYRTALCALWMGQAQGQGTTTWNWQVNRFWDKLLPRAAEGTEGQP